MLGNRYEQLQRLCLKVVFVYVCVCVCGSAYLTYPKMKPPMAAMAPKAHARRVTLSCCEGTPSDPPLLGEGSLLGSSCAGAAASGFCLKNLMMFGCNSCGYTGDCDKGIGGLVTIKMGREEICLKGR